MRRNIFFVALILLPTIIQAQFNINLKDYEIEKKDIERAREVVSVQLKEELAFPNPSIAARWYPDASLGLFLHWGIHSVVGAQPSWDMIANYRWGGKVSPPEKYYALTEQFNPTDYHPDRYLKAAKDAGFTYAVITTRHHDGYALWPSKYGIGTKQHLNGRDLLKDYVEACRKNGLKVGFYYSPTDWHFPGAKHPNEFDDKTRMDLPPIVDSAANYKNYERFLAYTLVQIEELLTRYGKIDILWLDGMSWRGIPDKKTEQIYAWIRSLQPDIVINDRWANIVTPDNPEGTSFRLGDFTTPFECTKPTYVPSEWWEHCHIWTSGGGGWGYDKTGTFRPLGWFFEYFVATRSLGGNYLINVGPSGNGDMHPNFYTKLDSLKTWMTHSKESLIGADPTPGVERSNVMMTSRGKSIWYVHLLPDFNGQVSVRTDSHPISIKLLRTGEDIPYIYRNGFVNFKLAPEQRTSLDDVVKITR